RFFYFSLCACLPWWPWCHKQVGPRRHGGTKKHEGSFILLCVPACLGRPGVTSKLGHGDTEAQRNTKVFLFFFVCLPALVSWWLILNPTTRNFILLNFFSAYGECNCSGGGTVIENGR